MKAVSTKTKMRASSALCRGVVTTLAIAVTATTALAFAGAAVAKEPTGDFAIFGQCPRFTAGVELCVYTETTSGVVTIGNATLPIDEDKNHPLIFQGGIIEHEGGKDTFVGALNGETLSKSPQQVPGGLFGLVGCSEIKGHGWAQAHLRLFCKLISGTALARVDAVVELAGEVGVSTANLEIRQGAVFTLPVKVKLENALLGSKCYVGSNADPIVLALTAGTTAPAPPNTPISGKIGTISFKDEFEFIQIANDTLVNNEFSAPGATGCGGLFSFLIDPVIDARLGLPSADGRNTIVQNNTIYVGGVNYVVKSEA